MRTLNNMPMCDFVELTCGKHNVLLDEGESIGKKELAEQAKKLIIEYKSIANPVAFRAAVVKQKKAMMRNAKETMFKICLNIISLNGLDEVKVLMKEIGYNMSSMDENTVTAKIKSELRRIEYERKRESNDDVPVEEMDEKTIRNMFDRELASLMTFFKMNIDTRVTSAAVYANMLHMADEQMKERKRAIANMKK